MQLQRHGRPGRVRESWRAAWAGRASFPRSCKRAAAPCPPGSRLPDRNRFLLSCGRPDGRGMLKLVERQGSAASGGGDTRGATHLVPAAHAQSRVADARVGGRVEWRAASPVLLFFCAGLSTCLAPCFVQHVTLLSPSDRLITYCSRENSSKSTTILTVQPRKPKVSLPKVRREPQRAVLSSLGAVFGAYCDELAVACETCLMMRGEAGAGSTWILRVNVYIWRGMVPASPGSN